MICTYPDCRCIVSTSTTNPVPDCPRQAAAAQDAKVRAMADPPNTILAAALLDQKVAGQFACKDYAYIAVLKADGTWGPGIAVANEPGYTPIDSEQFTWKVEADARLFCDGMNRHIGLNEAQVIGITVSSMGGRPYHR
jgi:hypothetical protein